MNGVNDTTAALVFFRYKMDNITDVYNRIGGLGVRFPICHRVPKVRLLFSCFLMARDLN